MSGKVILKPSKKAKFGWFTSIGMIIPFALVIFLGPFLESTSKDFLTLLAGVIFLSFWAYPYSKNIKNVYIASRLTAYWVGLLSIVITLSMYVALFAGINFLLTLIAGIINPFYVEMPDIMRFLYFIIVLFLIGLLYNKTEPITTRFFAERVWHLSLRDKVDVNLENL